MNGRIEQQNRPQMRSVLFVEKVHYVVKSCAQYAVPFTTIQPTPIVVKLLLRMFARWPDEFIHDCTTAFGVL